MPRSTGVHKLFLKGPDGKYFTLAGYIPHHNHSTVLWEWEASTENSDVADNALLTKPGVGGVGIWPTDVVCPRCSPTGRGCGGGGQFRTGNVP